MYICDNNESNTDMDDSTMYKILDDVEETTPNVHVNSNTYAPHKEKETKRSKIISNWKTYTPDKLKASKHTSLKVTETNVLENKENEANLLQTTARRQRRPSTMALHSSHISKQYSDLAEIKMELGKLQLIALKEEMTAKQKLNEMEFELKKKSLDLDIQLKQAQLRKLHTSSLL
ncbi:myb sant-like dna-binding domain-containing protein 3 protein [Lasius niger]|uniref:Myb sant-like dna-binding domain-containing protein 3 protein n=1 Tax=Lasius niger TaxID=67767 RepID=A0A0J7NAK5_LASNI|nr:myb sant-like dna-binding domain-containing protein 3 protein [Lasius niger]